MKQMKWIFLVLIVSMIIAWKWEELTFIKEPVHMILNPSLGKLLAFNKYLGMILIAAILNLAITLLQKFTIDKETMKEIKKEQKELKESMKKYKGHPEKLMELNQKQFELIGKSLPLTMRPIIFTSIPFILLFRWFHDIFGADGFLNGTIYLGFMTWFWFYLLISIMFSLTYRKVFDVL
jgi:uncharacterized membrane protein (DUF106 family)